MELLQLLALEFSLEPYDFFEKLLSLLLNVILDELEFGLVLGRQFGGLNILNENLALL